MTLDELNNVLEDAKQNAEYAWAEYDNVCEMFIENHGLTVTLSDVNAASDRAKAAEELARQAYQNREKWYVENMPKMEYIS